MKKLISFLILAFSLTAGLHAESALVTTLTTSSVKPLIVVGPRANFVYIANASTGAQVNIAFDGGAANGGTDPTTGALGKGVWLPAGQWIAVPAQQYVGKTISAIMATGTTTLSVSTDAPAGNSTFPTT